MLDDLQAAADESPVHDVTLAPYFLSKYEMTQAQWQRITGFNPSVRKPGYYPSGTSGDLVHPVERVSWDDCVATLAHSGLVLPTEAQWEYACRAGTTTPFNFGMANNAAESNCNGKSPYGTEEQGPALGRPVEVGGYRPNAFGLYDMHGGADEWCADLIGDNQRVIRGGSFFSPSPELLRSSQRVVTSLIPANYYPGCRVVMEVGKMGE